jgi:hypothetical protein
LRRILNDLGKLFLRSWREKVYVPALEIDNDRQLVTSCCLCLTSGCILVDSSVGRRCVVVLVRSLSNDGSQPTGKGPKSGTEVKLPKPPPPPQYSSFLPLAATSRSPCPKETERRTADGGRADAFAAADLRPAGGNCKQNPPAETAWEFPQKRGSSLVPVAAAGLSRALQSGGRRGREASEARELWEELVLLSPRSTECCRRNRDLSTKRPNISPENRKKEKKKDR